MTDPYEKVVEYRFEVSHHWFITTGYTFLRWPLNTDYNGKIGIKVRSEARGHLWLILNSKHDEWEFIRKTNFPFNDKVIESISDYLNENTPPEFGGEESKLKFILKQMEQV